MGSDSIIFQSMPGKLSIEEYIERAHKVHGDQYAKISVESGLCGTVVSLTPFIFHASNY
jgi:hypothetical protein